MPGCDRGGGAGRSRGPPKAERRSPGGASCAAPRQLGPGAAIAAIPGCRPTGTAPVRSRPLPPAQKHVPGSGRSEKAHEARAS